MKLNKRQLAKRDLQWKYWAEAIRLEEKPDEDGDVRAITAVIASFTSLRSVSEVEEFMYWCKDNNYQDLYDEYKRWEN